MHAYGFLVLHNNGSYAYGECMLTERRSKTDTPSQLYLPDGVLNNTKRLFYVASCSPFMCDSHS